MKKNKILLFFVILLLCFTSCSDCKNKPMYSIEDCLNFKKGDTVFTKRNYSIRKCLVLNNYPKQGIVEVVDVEWYWDVYILPYNNFSFK
jgi:hypothetical protein